MGRVEAGRKDGWDAPATQQCVPVALVETSPVEGWLTAPPPCSLDRR